MTKKTLPKPPGVHPHLGHDSGACPQLETEIYRRLATIIVLTFVLALAASCGGAGGSSTGGGTSPTPSPPPSGTTLYVGPTRTYTTPCAAIAAASDDDTIQIDAGLYQNDSCTWTANNLTLVGVLDAQGNRPHIDVSGMTGENGQPHIAEYKGIWVPYGSNTTVQNIEFSGAWILPSEGYNGAGIRISGQNMTILNCYFHDNQDGILESNIAGSNITIKFSEFASNGAGDGQTHNVYIGQVASLMFAFNYSHDANVGHLLKSRAAVNSILYNRLTGENGTDSYEIDLPNGGTSYVIGNLVEKGPNAQNNTMLAYLEEGTTTNNPGQDLYVVNNTFVHLASSGGYFVEDESTTTGALLQNNIFYGTATITNQSNATLVTNSTANPLFVDLSDYNYQLEAGSPDIAAGTPPGSANGNSLTPQYQYVDPACGQARTTVGIIDIGAYAYNGGGAMLSCR
jgi:hypothetical protein